MLHVLQIFCILIMVYYYLMFIVLGPLQCHGSISIPHLVARPFGIGDPSPCLSLPPCSSSPLCYLLLLVSRTFPLLHPSLLCPRPFPLRSSSVIAPVDGPPCLVG